jgi:hypothetical protein
LRELLAMLIGASNPAQIRAFARPGAGHKERHIRLLRRRRRSTQKQAHRERHANSNDPHLITSRHW